MQDHGFISKVNEWLGDAEGQWPQTCSKSSNENKCLHCDVVISAFCSNDNEIRFDSLKKTKTPNVKYEEKKKILFLVHMHVHIS